MTYYIGINLGTTNCALSIINEQREPDIVQKWLPKTGQ